MRADNDNNLAADMLAGADAIAAYLGRNRRAVYHLVSKGEIPCFRMGETICARKSKILEWIEAQEARAA